MKKRPNDDIWDLFKVQRVTERIMNQFEQTYAKLYPNPDLFKVMLHGRTVTKPRIIVNPETGDIYELNPKAQADKNGHCYHKLDLETVTYFEMRLNENGKTHYRNSPLKQPSQKNYTIKTFVFDDFQGDKKDTYRLTPQLYTAMRELNAMDPGWIHLNFMQGFNKMKPLYTRAIKANILLYENIPVGMAEWLNPKDNTIQGAEIGIHRDHRGKGLGSVLFDYTNAMMFKDGAEERLLITSTRDFFINGNNRQELALEFYKKKGFEVTREFTVAPEKALQIFKNRAEKGNNNTKGDVLLHKADSTQNKIGYAYREQILLQRIIAEAQKIRM